MQLKLFTFIYNVLMKKSDDKENNLFLPKILSNMTTPYGKKYLPINILSWSTNTLPDAATFSGSIASLWFSAYYQDLAKLAEASPNPPLTTKKMINNASEIVSNIVENELTVVGCPGIGPSLAIKQLTINGLSNIKVSGNKPSQVLASKNGYNCTIELYLNAYPSMPGKDWSHALTLSGKLPAIDSNTQKKFLGFSFSMSQCLCFANRENLSECVPLPGNVDAPKSPYNPQSFIDTSNGKAAISILDAKVLADVTITVSDAEESLAVRVNKLIFQGKDAQFPTYKVENLMINATNKTKSYVKVWAEFFKNTISTPDAQKALTNEIEKSLNETGNLQEVSSIMTTQLNNKINNTLGEEEVSISKMSNTCGNNNQVDIYIYNRIACALNSPSSNLYLPKIILSMTSPQLEPYNVEISLPDLNIDESFFNMPARITNIQFPGGLTATGLSNLIAPKGSFTFGDQTTQAKFPEGLLNPGPTLNINNQSKKIPNPPLLLQSNFSINIAIGNNGALGPFRGNIRICIESKSDETAPNLDVIFTTTGEDIDALSIKFSQIKFNTSIDEMNISIFLSDGSEFNSLIDNIANNNRFKEAILNAINNQISKQLLQISNQVTGLIRQQMNNEI